MKAPKPRKTRALGRPVTPPKSKLPTPPSPPCTPRRQPKATITLESSDGQRFSIPASILIYNSEFIKELLDMDCLFQPTEEPEDEADVDWSTVGDGSDEAAEKTPSTTPTKRRPSSAAYTPPRPRAILPLANVHSSALRYTVAVMKRRSQHLLRSRAGVDCLPEQPFPRAFLDGIVTLADCYQIYAGLEALLREDALANHPVIDYTLTALRDILLGIGTGATKAEPLVHFQSYIDGGLLRPSSMADTPHAALTPSKIRALGRNHRALARDGYWVSLDNWAKEILTSRAPATLRQLNEYLNSWRRSAGQSSKTQQKIVFREEAQVGCVTD